MYVCMYETRSENPDLYLQLAYMNQYGMQINVYKLNDIQMSKFFDIFIHLKYPIIKLDRGDEPIE